MITNAIILSLQITAIYIVFEKTMLLGWFKGPVATAIDDGCIFFFEKIKASETLMKGKRLSRYIQKPLWDCLPCMASVWTIFLTWSFDIRLILIVCGINILIDKFINDERITVI